MESKLLDSAPPMPKKEAFADLQKKVGLYIINLDRCPERYHFVLQSAQSLNLHIERISAIDGVQMSFEEMHSFTDVDSYRKAFGGKEPGKGTIACALSHHKAWEAFICGSFEYGLILEDDVSFDSTALKNILYLLLSNDQNPFFDICLLNIIHWGGPVSVKKLTSCHHLCIYFFNIKGGGGYILTRKAAEKFIAGFFPITLPVDHYLTRPWLFNLKLCGVSPVMIHQTFGNSEIALISRESRKTKKTFCDFFDQAYYYLKVESARFWSAIKDWLRSKIAIQ